jgi:PAS domain S-box-containing protein
MIILGEDEQDRQRILHNLGERVKELNCLYGLAKLIETPNVSLETILQETPNLLSTAYQYPECTCSRIVFEDKQFKTKNFKETSWKQSADIFLKERKIGIIDVFYLQEKPILDEGPFLKEERRLLDAIAGHLSRVVDRIRTDHERIYLKEFNESVIEAINESLLVIDPLNYRILAANSEASKELMISGEDLSGMTCYEATHHSATPCLDPYVCPVRKVLATGRAVKVEHVHFDKNQNPINVEIAVYPVKDNEGKVVRLIHLSRNINKRKKSEEALAKSEAKYRALVENADDAILLADLKGNTLYRNPAYFRQLGFKEGDSEVFAKLYPDDLPVIKEKMTELLETGFSAVEYRIKHNNGSWVNRYSRSTLLTNANHEPFAILSVIRDITLQKKTEEKLREAEEKHRTLLNSANVLVQSVDSEGKYLFVNEEWKKILGYNEKDMTKITIMDVIRKDHLQYCMDVFKQVMAGLSIHNVETVFVTKDRRELTVSGNACPIFKDGKFVSTVAFFEDITERKKNEEKIKENNRKIELMNEKLRVVGSLTRHDVRNKLSTITGYSHILKKKHPDQADLVDGLDKMVQAVRESLKIFDFAKAYEQIGIEKLVFIDVEKAINEAVDMFSGLTFKVVNDCHGLTVRADSLLRQLIYNFIDNTRKYGKKTKVAKIHYKKLASGNLELIYEDDGVGIPFEDKQQLFKQGFSTGGSTGFGLFLAKKMIDVYGWSVDEEGKPGEGARFVITIPKNDDENNFFIFQDSLLSVSTPDYLSTETLQTTIQTR